MMFVEIGEGSARELLRACGSPAGNEKAYRSRRIRDGWCFSEITDDPRHSSSWVVADNGLLTKVLNNETDEAAVAFLLKMREDSSS